MFSCLQVISRCPENQVLCLDCYKRLKTQILHHLFFFKHQLTIRFLRKSARVINREAHSVNMFISFMPLPEETLEAHVSTKHFSFFFHDLKIGKTYHVTVLRYSHLTHCSLRKLQGIIRIELEGWTIPPPPKKKGLYSHIARTTATNSYLSSIWCPLFYKIH